MGEICCDDPENAAMIVLFLVNRLWISITDLIIEEEKTHSAPDYSEYLRLTECCRTCLEKWHHIPAGKNLTEMEQAYVVDVLMEWIEREMRRNEEK